MIIITTSRRVLLQQRVLAFGFYHRFSRDLYFKKSRKIEFLEAILPCGHTVVCVVSFNEYVQQQQKEESNCLNASISWLAIAKCNE